MQEEIEQSSSSSAPVDKGIKTIRFALGKGNKNDGKLVVVHKNSLKDANKREIADGGTIRHKEKMPHFIRDVMLSEEFLGSKPPKVLISVTGAAGAYVMDGDLEQKFSRGLVNAAKSTTAWIVSGGTDVGVMHYVGEAIRKLVTDVPTIGFATYNMINNKEFLKSSDTTVEYNSNAPFIPGKNANLNANHSHFVLIESEKDQYGEEIEARSDFEEYICTEFKVPLCLIVVNGGGGTLLTVAEGAARGFPVIIMEHTGRAADAIAREIRRLRKQPYEHLNPMNFNPVEQGYLKTIIQHEAVVTLYSGEMGPLDLEILKAILTCRHTNFLNKLNLAVEWDRPDLADHIINSENLEKSVTPDEFATVLSKALETSLELDKPKLFQLLSDRGARKTEVRLSTLYTDAETGGATLDPAIARYLSHLSNSSQPAPTRSVTVSQKTPLLEGASSVQAISTPVLVDVNQIKEIFSAMSPIFESYVTTLDEKFTSNRPLLNFAEHSEISMKVIAYGTTDSPKHKPEELPNKNEGENARYTVKNTDTMLWAILMGKLELAKVIWERTVLPVNAALVAVALCKGVADVLLNERQEYLEAADWFEDVSIKFLEKLDYPDAKLLLKCTWDEFDFDTLELAVKAECKNFVGTSSVQRYLDELLYRDKHGGIPPGTSHFNVVMCVFMPFLLYFSRSYDNLNGDKIIATGRWYHFYTLPYTKYWTSTTCYIGYLALLAVVLVGYTYDDIQISAAQIVLWIWMLGYAVEEISQWREEGMSYFKYTSNQMDVFIIFLQALYIATAIAASASGNSSTLNASADILIILTIISYVRLMDVFSISKELGPLYFVMQKIVGDVFRWIFVFVVFAIGFQVSIMALNQQVVVIDETTGNSSDGANVPGIWEPTIEGGTFMGAFFTIIGDWGSTMDVIKVSTFGAIVVAVYALIAQIMLVNLLIAMMGDTFESVKENSDLDWKFYRYGLIKEYTFASFHPPPFNLVVLPIKKLYFLHKPRLTKEDLPGGGVTPKERQRIKKLMKQTKDNYIEEITAEEQKTIGAVSDLAREQFKLILEEQQSRHNLIDQKLTDLIAKQQGAGSSSVGGGGSNSNELKTEMVHVREDINSSMKLEISQLQKTLLEAIKHEQPAQHLNLTMQGNSIKVTWAPGITVDVVQKIMSEYKPFLEWVESMSKPENTVESQVKAIHFSTVDMFGPRIGFVKFNASVVNETGQAIPGIVFMRGGAVGMMIILKVEDEGSALNGRLFTILTIQPRVAAGYGRFPEIPAGMLDGGDFVGMAAKELKEEVGLEIHGRDLIDLTGLAYNGAYKGMYPSAGGCDEFLRLFVYRTRVNEATLHTYQNKMTGEIEEGEKICLKVIPFEDLWFEAPDAKALSSLHLYTMLLGQGKISADF